MTNVTKTAIVTGASRGIGAAIAKRLARDGYSVIISYVSGRQNAQTVVDEIRTTGGEATAIAADVTRAADVARLFDEAEASYGAVSVLVNNAGRAIRMPLAELTEDDFDTVMSTNLRGTFLALSEAARRLADGGAVVNVSASFQGAPIPGYGAYAASKMAVEKLTEVAAIELGERQIRVNAVRPGPTNTDLFNEGKSDEVRAAFAEKHALGRIGEPEDVAGAVSFLVSDDGRWVSGQSLGANGGYW